MNCLYSFAAENKRESDIKVCANKDFCNIVMFSEDIKILEVTQYQKSNKAPFIIYAGLECLMETINRCKNNPQNSSTAKLGKHTH